MSELETGKGCDAHKAVTACLRGVKAIQHERTEQLEEMKRDIELRVSTRLFLYTISVLIAFLSFNAVQNVKLAQEMAVISEKMTTLSKTQDDIKKIMERYHP
jgi:hypothetical protein